MLGLVLVGLISAEPMQVIIFAGGVTEADGAAALASFKKLPSVVTLPAGEPRVVESATLPGLKPGFRVVTLGTCRAPGPVLAALKAVYPGTYAKPLLSEVPEKCPTLGTSTIAAVEPAVKSGKLVLSAYTSTESSQDERGHDATSSTVGFVLVEKSSGLVRDVASVEGERAERSGDGPAGWEYQACTVAVTAEKNGFLVERTCADERTGCALRETSIPKSWTETQRVTVKGEALVVSGVKKVVTDRSECVAGSDEGD